METIKHKFLECKFRNGDFQTHNAILDITPYNPEVMIIGTFNPDTPNSNFADFFYGRNYFWPAFKNLSENKIALVTSRMPKRGKSKTVPNPSLDEIFEFCGQFKLTFADFISEVFQHENPDYSMLENDNIIYNGKVYNLIQDGKTGQINGLEQLDSIKQVRWSTQNIIKYLYENPQIKKVYFTRQPTAIWKNQWDIIMNFDYGHLIDFQSIYSPSAQGGALHQQTGIYKMGKMYPLINHWIYNNNPKFGHLDHEWLKSCGVNPDNF